MFNKLQRYFLQRTFDRQANAIFQAKVKENPILTNAWRLAQDCDLLFLNKRYPTALALAVVALEEVGKYLLDCWEQQPLSSGVENDKPFTYDKKRELHKTKQVAIVALFQQAQARATYLREGIDFHNLNEEQVRKLIQILKDVQEEHEVFVTLVCNKIYERVKWSGFYYDPEMASKGIEPAIVTRDAASEMMSLLAKSLRFIVDDKVVYLSRYSFPAVLEQWKNILAKQRDWIKRSCPRSIDG